MNVKLIAFNCRFSHSNLALFYVRNELERKCPTCRISMHQYTINDPYYGTLLKILKGSPDYIFFSVYIWNASLLYRMVRDVVKVLPHSRIILGGPEVTCKAPPDLPGQCVVVKGPIEGMKAEFYKDLAGNTLQPEYRAAAAADFSFPYREEDFAGVLAHRNIYYESSRGCPFSCIYCLSSIDKEVCHKPLETVKEELMVLVKRQPKVIRFVDRTFNTLYERTLELWQFLADLPGNTLFHFEIAPDRFSPEMLQFLQDIPAGRFQFEIGLQSTTAATLQSINRWIDTERALNNIKTLIGFDNIHIHVDLILGLPFETVSSFKNSFEDVFRLMPHYIQMGLLKVLPGTRIRHTNGYDLIYCQSPPYELLANKWLDHNSLQHCYWLGECIEAFYNNRFFRSVFDYLQKGKASAWEFFEELFTVCKEHDFFTLAKTQEFMSRLLFELFNRRGEGDIGRELLRYEWLRSGHKFLPDHLGQPDFKGTRDRLYFSLPQNFPPFYTYPTREVFFKKGVFLNFSGEVLQILGFEADDTGGTLCFLQEQTTGVHRHQKSVLIAKGRKIMELEKGD